MKIFKKKSTWYFLILSLILILGISAGGYLNVWLVDRDAIFTFNQQSSYWPTSDWKRSSPEKQGMDSAVLSKIFDEIKKKPPLRQLTHKLISTITKEPERDAFLIKSLLVIRNGFIVVEAYSDYDKSELHPIYSSTKSLVSAITGIALDTLPQVSLEQPVLEFFPKLKIMNNSVEKNVLTISNLLTMSCGFDWPEWETGYMNPQNPVYQMLSSENWISFILDKPVIQQPGTTFNYNSGCTQLLTAIIHKTTDTGIADFTQNHLFNPLGISDYIWDLDKQGIPNGSFGLNMNVSDMAKFGYLYLKGGFWDGRQIIPKNWVEESTKKHIDIPGSTGWFIDFYGYKWYIHSWGFHSLGYGGQYIFVLPDLDIVVVIVSLLAVYETLDPISFIENYIIPAAISDQPLPDNAKALANLKEKIKAL
jgi:CubicO group peptidase (beta-lactamase class C family)